MLKKIFIFCLFVSSLFSYEFSYMKLNNLSMNKFLNIPETKEFLAGFLLKNDLTFLIGIKDKNILHYIPNGYNYNFVYNYKNNIAVISKKYISYDIKEYFYPDNNNFWIDKPLIVYIPYYNKAIIIINAKNNQELYDLKNVYKFAKKYFDHIIFIGNFNSNKNEIKDLSKLNLKIYINHQKTKINFNKKYNKYLNVISNEDLKIKIDHSIIEKSLIGYKDYIKFSSFYPLYIKY